MKEAILSSYSHNHILSDVIIQKTNTSEAYSEASQTSNMKLFAKTVNDFRPFNWILNTFFHLFKVNNKKHTTIGHLKIEPKFLPSSHFLSDF